MPKGAPQGAPFLHVLDTLCSDLLSSGRLSLARCHERAVVDVLLCVGVAGAPAMPTFFVIAFTAWQGYRQFGLTWVTKRQP
jgi:hypothetical protein